MKFNLFLGYEPENEIDLFLGFWKILDWDEISIIDRNRELGYGAVKYPETKFNSMQQNLCVCHDSLEGLMGNLRAFKPSRSHSSSSGDHTFTRCHNDLIYSPWAPENPSWGSSPGAQIEIARRLGNSFFFQDSVFESEKIIIRSENL